MRSMGKIAREPRGAEIIVKNPSCGISTKFSSGFPATYLRSERYKQLFRAVGPIFFWEGGTGFEKGDTGFFGILREIRGLGRYGVFKSYILH